MIAICRHYAMWNFELRIFFCHFNILYDKHNEGKLLGIKCAYWVQDLNRKNAINWYCSFLCIKTVQKIKYAHFWSKNRNEQWKNYCSAHSYLAWWVRQWHMRKPAKRNMAVIVMVKKSCIAIKKSRMKRLFYFIGFLFHVSGLNLLA